MDEPQQENQPLLGNPGLEDVTYSRGKRSWKLKALLLAVATVAIVALTVGLSLYSSKSSATSAAAETLDTVLQTQGKTGSADKYVGFSVLSVNVQDGGQNILRDIANQMLLDLWTDAGPVNGEVLVGVPAESLDKTKKMLEKANLQWGTRVQDVSRIIDKEHSEILKASKLGLEGNSGKRFHYDNYNTYDQMIQEVNRLASNCPEGFLCEVTSIGQTYEENDLVMLHISKKNTSNKAIWIDSLIHCREWITGATLMNIIRRLIVNYGSEDSVTKLMDNYDWYFLPVMNPDGYTYTWTTDRLWRQNREPNRGSECVGTDLNRNYEFMWGGVGASKDPCNNEYRGDHPASARETQHMQKTIEQLGNNILAWINLHSCAEKWLIPWAFTEEGHPGKCDYPSDYAGLFAVAEKATQALDKTNGQNFTAGNWCQAMYASSGVLQDHVKAVGGVKYAYTLELRAGESCFIVNPNEIVSSANEVYNGLLAMVDAISELESGNLKPC